MKIHCLYDELTHVKDLRRHPKNPNKHSKEQIERLAQILKYQGWRYAIKVSRQSGFITSGHGRLEAAIHAGESNVPVVFQDYDDADQEYADIVADNSVALWAELDLANINTEVGNLGPDFDIDLLGIKDFILDMSDKLEPGCDEDEVPEKVEPKAKTGDIYSLGNHRLMCGDSTSIDAVEKLMNGEKTEICFTSPPYNAGKTESLSGNTHTTDNKYNSYDDSKNPEEWKSLVIDGMSSAMSVSQTQFFNIQQLAGNKIALTEFAYLYRKNLIDTIIWDKGHAQPAMAKNVLNSQFEFIYIFSKDEMPARSIPNCSFRGDVPNIYQGPPNRGREFSKIHAAIFPVHLPEYIITKFTNDNASILDLFGGSGTTLIACEKTNRKCFMMEIDPHYIDLIIARWEKYTGKKAELTNG